MNIVFLWASFHNIEKNGCFEWRLSNKIFFSVSWTLLIIISGLNCDGFQMISILLYHLSTYSWFLQFYIMKPNVKIIRKIRDSNYKQYSSILYIDCKIILNKKEKPFF